jgi:GNAT superfamily N-acetyltransferase
MIQITRTDSGSPAFQQLVKQLDADLAERDGTEHSFYHQFNKINALRFVIVAYEDEVPVSCGAIKALDETSMEVKRMYTLPGHRGKGLATLVLQSLEQWAKELSYKKCRLETGKRQPEAIQLYKKNGYMIIPNYGQYAGIDNSVCFEKAL